MADPPALKRPKLEKDDSAHWPRPSTNGAAATTNGAPPQGDQDDDGDITEEAVIALIAHRERDVERCKLKLLHYQSLLDTAEAKLAEAQARMARYRDRKQRPRPTQKRPTPPPPERKRAPSPAPAQQPPGKPQLVIPGPNARPTARPVQTPDPMPALNKASSSSLTPPERSRTEERKPKRTIEDKEPQNLIPSIKKSSATLLKFPGGSVVPSQHRRKLRCLELCPVNDQLVATSALDGSVILWEVQPKGPSISFRGRNDCFSPKHRWPEDIAWHPDGDTIFAVYTADGGDSQVSLTNVISGQGRANTWASGCDYCNYPR